MRVFASNRGGLLLLCIDTSSEVDGRLFRNFPDGELSFSLCAFFAVPIEKEFERLCECELEAVDLLHLFRFPSDDSVGVTILGRPFCRVEELR